MKKIVRFAAKNIIPGAGAAMDAMDVLKDPKTGEPCDVPEGNIASDRAVQPFLARDADQHGAAKYSTATQNRADDEVVDAQFVLAKSGWLSFSDIDGCVGPATLDAIAAYESAQGVDFYTGEPITQPARKGESLMGEEDVARIPYCGVGPDGIDLTMLSPRVLHTSQAAPVVGDVQIPGKDFSRPVSQIGCASVALVSVWNFYSDENIYFSSGIRALIDAKCYNDARDLIWDRAIEAISQACDLTLSHREISHAETRTCIEKNTPVLCHAGRGHWVVGVGYSASMGIIYCDPATVHGDGYEKPALNSQKQGSKQYVFDRFIAIEPA